MDIQTIRRHITVEEYHRMGEAGIFQEDERLELIDGEIIKMTPIGIRHASCVNRTAEFFITRLATRAIVSIQNPVCLGGHSGSLVVDLVSDCVEMCRNPTPFGYEWITKKRSSDAIAPSSFPEVVATVDWILGKL